MNTAQTLPWILFPLHIERPRAFSFRGAIDDGLEPREYRSMLHEEPMEVEALLDFKIWGKSPCLTCYFRNIRTGEKFCLTAFDNNRSTRYTPRDNEIDFSEQGIEHVASADRAEALLAERRPTHRSQNRYVHHDGRRNVRIYASVDDGVEKIARLQSQSVGCQ